MSALDAGLAAIKAAKVAKAAKRAEPFYSAVDEAAKAMTRGKGTGKEFMTELIKVKGVKPTEIKERGLQKIEAMPKMTKEEFIQKLEENPPLLRTKKGALIPIWRVRVKVRKTTVQIGRGARARNVVTGDNHHMAVFEIQKRGKAAYVGDVVSQIGRAHV